MYMWNTFRLIVRITAVCFRCLLRAKPQSGEAKPERESGSDYNGSGSDYLKSSSEGGGHFLNQTSCVPVAVTRTSI